jgi:serine protease Do
MLPGRIPKLRFSLKNVFVLMLGIAIGFALNKWPVPHVSNIAPVWNVLGLNLSEEPRSTFDGSKTRYRGGMHVVSVQPNSAAAREGILPGDITVGIGKWETASATDVDYVIAHLNRSQTGKLKFYVLRGQNILYGHLDVVAAR